MLKGILDLTAIELAVAVEMQEKAIKNFSEEELERIFKGTIAPSTYKTIAERMIAKNKICIV